MSFRCCWAKPAICQSYCCPNGQSRWKKKKSSCIFMQKSWYLSKSALSIHSSPLFTANLCRQWTTPHTINGQHFYFILFFFSFFLSKTTKSKWFCMRFNFIITNCGAKNIPLSGGALAQQAWYAWVLQGQLRKSASWNTERINMYFFQPHDIN